MASVNFSHGLLAALLAVASPASAQPWIAYVNPEYRFAINFPAEPVAEDSAYSAADGSVLGARRFYAQSGSGRYSVTVVIFVGDGVMPDTELLHAAQALARQGEIRYRGQSFYNGVPGEDVSLTTDEGRRVFATILAHDNYLHIVEAEVERESGSPIAFTHSVVLIDAQGNPVTLDD